jgi:hypothetical protein
MSVGQRKVVLVVGLAQAVTSALGQTAAPGVNAAQSRLPDFSAFW